jgi:hypothetical protein
MPPRSHKVKSLEAKYLNPLGQNPNLPKGKQVNTTQKYNQQETPTNYTEAQVNLKSQLRPMKSLP